MASIGLTAGLLLIRFGFPAVGIPVGQVLPCLEYVSVLGFLLKAIGKSGGFLPITMTFYCSRLSVFVLGCVSLLRLFSFTVYDLLLICYL